VCYTSTGYRSNYEAFPALLDENSHSSMSAGTYLAQSGCMRKLGHNDMVHLESILNELAKHYERVIVAVECLYRYVMSPHWLSLVINEYYCSIEVYLLALDELH
jgi:7-keto-8-aminopelargonate synthetase-like enzyme